MWISFNICIWKTVGLSNFTAEFRSDHNSLELIAHLRTQVGVTRKELIKYLSEFHDMRIWNKKTIAPLTNWNNTEIANLSNFQIVHPTESVLSSYEKCLQYSSMKISS